MEYLRPTSSRGKLLPRCYSRPPSFVRFSFKLINLLCLIHHTVVMWYWVPNWAVRNCCLTGDFSYVLMKNLENLHCSYMLASQLHKPDGHLLIWISETEMASWNILYYISDSSNPSSCCLFLLLFLWLNILFACIA